MYAHMSIHEWELYTPGSGAGTSRILVPENGKILISETAPYGDHKRQDPGTGTRRILVLELSGSNTYPGIIKNHSIHRPEPCLKQ